MINPLFADENPDPAAVALWQVEHRQVTELLDRVEHVERAILEALGCPTDPAGIYAILNGEQPAPWPKRTAARDKKRAKVAMHALCWARKARGHLNPLNENANLAVESALIAGALAGDVVITAEDAALGAQAREINRRRAGRGARSSLSGHPSTIHHQAVSTALSEQRRREGRVSQRARLYRSEDRPANPHDSTRAEALARGASRKTATVAKLTARVMLE